MNKDDFLFRELKLRYGNVKRARGNFLYTEKGVRITDLYREAGRAILGWPCQESAVTVFKNVLSRGINGSFPTDFSYRMDKAVSELFNSSRKCLFFAFKEDAVFFVESEFKNSCSYFKPWNVENEKKAFSESECIIFEPVFPWTQSVYIACIPSDFDISDKEKKYRTIKLPSPLLAGLTRSVYNLIKALQNFKEKDFFIYDTFLKNYFIRKGPYLFSKVEKEDYDEFFKHCLDCHILISPSYDIPSIVPFNAQKGVFELLKKNPFGEKND